MSEKKQSSFFLILTVLAISTLGQINADMYTPSFVAI